MPLSIGARLGPYDILSPLGAGGFGEVYKARDTRLDRTVAIKILPSADPELKARFEREASASSCFLRPSSWPTPTRKQRFQFILWSDALRSQKKRTRYRLADIGRSLTVNRPPAAAQESRRPLAGIL